MIAGWDIGGAHLKCATLDLAGRLRGVWEVPCRLWEGLHRLEEALATLPPTLGERLRSEELVYAGVLRTPIMAVADRVPCLGAPPAPPYRDRRIRA